MRVAIADDRNLIYSDDYRDGWVAGFSALGAEVKVVDISVLRRAMRHRASPYSTRGQGQIIKAAAQNIAGMKPDLVWCHHGRSASHPTFLEVFKRAGIPTAVYLCDEPYETGETATYSPRFDYVFTMDPCTIETHRLSRKNREPNVFYLPPGVDTHRFVSKPYFNAAGELRRKTPTFFLGNADLVPRKDWLVPVEKAIEGADIRFFPSRNRGRPVAKGDPRWVGLDQHAALYSGCLVGLNVHRSPCITEDCFKMRVIGRSRHMPIPSGLKLAAAKPVEWGTGFWNEGNLPAAHVNPRFLEMAACGTLVVSDAHRSELRRLFPFAPQAQDPEHFLELVFYYLHHPKEAQEIGQACSFQISKRHTYRHRAAEVLTRVGLMAPGEGSHASSLGEPTDWLTTQDLEVLGVSSSSGPTGPFERWSPAFGKSWMQGSGRVSAASSTDAPTPWLS